MRGEDLRNKGGGIIRLLKFIKKELPFNSLPCSFVRSFFSFFSFVDLRRANWIFSLNNHLFCRHIKLNFVHLSSPSFNTALKPHKFIYNQIYMCVRVCVCIREEVASLLNLFFAHSLFHPYHYYLYSTKTKSSLNTLAMHFNRITYYIFFEICYHK